MSNIIIHPTAIVSSKAQIGDNVSIGAFTIIEDDVVIGNNTEIRSHIVIANGARIGNDCRIFKGAVIATEPQDLKFKDEPTTAEIGDRTTIREYVTVNRGSNATKRTTVGSDCLIMTYCHVAHDCRLHNHIVMANSVQLAGHVAIHDWVVVGGVAKIHQFCKVGAHAMIGADCKIVKDVAPYTTIGKEPPKVEGLNKIGLLRRGFSREQIDEIESFYKIILYSGYNNTDGINKYIQENNINNDIQYCIDFINSSERGIYR